MKGTIRKITSQERGFINFLQLVTSAGLPLMKNILALLAKNVLIPLGLMAAASARDAAIQKKIFGSGTTALKTSNEELNNMKVVKSLEESNLLIKC